jgi:hypothetical protein
MADVKPRVMAFVGIPRGPDGRLERERRQAAVRHGFWIVRWHLHEQPS